MITIFLQVVKRQLRCSAARWLVVQRMCTHQFERFISGVEGVCWGDWYLLVRLEKIASSEEDDYDGEKERCEMKRC